jgi:DNA-binding XRE family transcriptional regulator
MEEIKGEHLAILRMVYGYNTQEDLAKIGNISPTTIHRYETSDEVTPKIRQFYEKVLNFDLANGLIYINELRKKRNKNIMLLS